MNSKKIILGLVILVVTVSFWYFLNNQNRSSITEDVEMDLATSTPTREIPILYRKPPREVQEDNKEYRNEFNWFQLTLPEKTIITETKQAGGIRNISLSYDSGDIIKMYIVPHGDPEITEYRINQDLPSGIMDDIEQIEIDGVSAKIFTSERAGLGKTKEVWFIAKGFLYEIYVPEALENWLIENLNSWEFL